MSQMSGGASSNGGGGVPSGGVSNGVGSGSLDSAGNAPVFCFGDRILLELQTQKGATSFLGLDDWASESSSLLEAPPISVLTTEMPKAREERRERQLPLPPMMEGMSDMSSNIATAEEPRMKVGGRSTAHRKLREHSRSRMTLPSFTPRTAFSSCTALEAPS